MYLFVTEIVAVRFWEKEGKKRKGTQRYRGVLHIALFGEAWREKEAEKEEKRKIK